jgi:Cu-Zn family superoxide dismutase
VGTEISGRIEGLTPNGMHAFHIHELGDLMDSANGCNSLSSHYNPFGESHGGPDSCHRHLGDLGNIIADQNGVSTF